MLCVFGFPLCVSYVYCYGLRFFVSCCIVFAVVCMCVFVLCWLCANMCVCLFVFMCCVVCASVV